MQALILPLVALMGSFLGLYTGEPRANIREEFRPGKGCRGYAGIARSEPFSPTPMVYPSDDGQPIVGSDPLPARIFPDGTLGLHSDVLGLELPLEQGMLTL